MTAGTQQNETKQALKEHPLGEQNICNTMEIRTRLLSLMTLIDEASLPILTLFIYDGEECVFW